MNDRTVVDLFSLADRVALVTGATGHLGAAIAQGLAEAGASVIATSRNQPRAQEIVDALPRSANAQHRAVELNHCDQASIQRAVAEALDAAGRIDVLVNNAHQPTTRTWRDAGFDDVAAQLENAAGYFTLARLVRDHVVARAGAGSIILLGSMYGRVSSDPAMYEGIGPGNPVAYQVLKGGVLQLTRHLAVHWARDGVRVNCLSPGPFPNPQSAPAPLMNRLAAKSPMGRVGTPDELKGAVVFLASDASSYVTGQELAVDGGWTAW